MAPSSLPIRPWLPGAESGQGGAERGGCPTPGRAAALAGQARVCAVSSARCPRSDSCSAPAGTSPALGPLGIFSDKRTKMLNCSLGRGRPSPSALLDDPPLKRGHSPSSDTGQPFLRTSCYGQTAEAGPRGHRGQPWCGGCGGRSLGGDPVLCGHSPPSPESSGPCRAPGGGKGTASVSQAPSDQLPELPGLLVLPSMATLEVRQVLGPLSCPRWRVSQG